MKLAPYSALTLSLAGLILVGMGLYFIFLRPPLLPEDLRYMGIPAQKSDAIFSGLLNWLQKVFMVMGSYIFTAGLLTIYISRTSFLLRSPGSFAIVALAGLSSIVAMTTINFIIGSEFKWLILSFNFPWAIALILYKLHK
ncbi:MAG: hypothetical protein EOO07_25045 [Chitinophagaceae bacterium]|nr:MAG: hypothetical protein EOO07_25045 [Chitinophagaceae bacterium]